MTLTTVPRYLADRGVGLEVAVARGYRIITDAADLPKHYRDDGHDQEVKVEFGPDVAKKLTPATPGLLIPLYDHEGSQALHQIRLDCPRVIDERILKFEVPGNIKRGRNEGDLPVDVNPLSHREASDPEIPMIITEGIPKVDALETHRRQHGIDIIPVGLTGVTMGYETVSRPSDALSALMSSRGMKPTTEEKAALSALRRLENESPASHRKLTEGLAALAEEARCVFMCFDADWRTNRKVGSALARTGYLLTKAGCDVFLVDIPPLAGDKSGIDDALAAGVMLQGLLDSAVPADTIRWMMPELYTDDDWGKAQRVADRIKSEMGALKYVA